MDISYLNDSSHCNWDCLDFEYLSIFLIFFWLWIIGDVTMNLKQPLKCSFFGIGMFKKVHYKYSLWKLEAATRGVNFAKFLITAFLQNNFGHLLLGNDMLRAFWPIILVGISQVTKYEFFMFTCLEE